MKGKRICTALLALVMTAAVLLAAGSPAVGAGYTDAKVKSYEEQIKQLEEKQKTQRAYITKLQNERSSVSAQKQALDEALETTQRKMEICETLLAELETDITDLRNQITATKEEY